MIQSNIKTLRTEKNLSQKELGNLLGVSLKTISHWESDYTEPPVSAIIKMKKIFDVRYEDILE